MTFRRRGRRPSLPPAGIRAFATKPASAPALRPTQQLCLTLRGNRGGPQTPIRLAVFKHALTKASGLPTGPPADRSALCNRQDEPAVAASDDHHSATPPTLAGRDQQHERPLP